MDVKRKGRKEKNGQRNEQDSIHEHSKLYHTPLTKGEPSLLKSQRDNGRE